MGNEVSGPVSAAETAAESPASTPAATLTAGPAPGTTQAQAQPVAVQEGNGAAELQRRSSASAAGDAAAAPRPSALVIVGPSGVGKNTLIKQLMEGNNQFGFSISHTTRQPRQGEKVGQGDARSRHACSAGVHARPSRWPACVRAAWPRVLLRVQGAVHARHCGGPVPGTCRGAWAPVRHQRCSGAGGPGRGPRVCAGRKCRHCLTILASVEDRWE